jgi:hypothetical protein
MGFPKINTYVSAMLLVISLPACIFASIEYGLVGVAWTYLALALIELLTIQTAFFRVTGLPVRRYVATVWRPLLASAVMAAAVLQLRVRLLDGRTLVETLVAMISIGVLTYVAALMLAWWISRRPSGAESSILEWLRARMQATPS